MASYYAPTPAFGGRSRRRIPADLALHRQNRASQPFHYYLNSRTNTRFSAPHDGRGYMAASRRSPLIRDQWEDEEDRHRRSRDHRPHHQRPPTPEPRKREGGGGHGPKAKVSASDEPSQSTQKLRHRSRSPRSRTNKPQHSPRREELGERDNRSRHIEDEKHSRRGRDREYYASASYKERAYSPPRERRSRYSEYEHRREHSPRSARPLSPPRRHKGHDRPLVSPRGDYYASRDYQTSRSERYRDEYDLSGRYARSRSPVTLDHYRPEVPRRRSPSLDRYRRHREEPHPSARKARSERSPHDRARSPDTRDHPLASTRASSPGNSRISKSSKRSEKQKQRTLNHLRQKAGTKAKANDFLRRLSISPPPDDHRLDDERMQSTRPIQSILDEPSRQQGSRPASPPRPIPSFDDSRSGHGADLRNAFPMHGMKVGDPYANQRRGPPHIDTRQSYAPSPQYVTPTSSYHGSPHSASPYSQGRGAWPGQHYVAHSNQSMAGYSPPHRQSSYPLGNTAQGQYYATSPYPNHPQQMQSGFQSPSYRGGHASMRGGNHNYPSQPDRRYSGGQPPTPTYAAPQNNNRGRGGHFQNLQWTASHGTRGGKQPEPQSGAHSGHSQSPAGSVNIKPEPVEEDNPFRPSKDFQVEDQGAKEIKIEDGSRPPPSRNSSSSQQSKEASRFSFAFKAKPSAPPAAKPPVPDLISKMKEPPPVRKDKAPEPPKAKAPPPLNSREPPPKHRDRRGDPWVERRDDRRDREHDPRYRDDRRNEREHWDEYRADPRYGGRADREKERERSPVPRKVKKIMKREKPRPKLPSEFVTSESVYYRKPGNESVVGSGTYGKVFKAIHVYTKELVALKKIRMEGEKDGFPVTAVREIKLLQSLKHHNVVSLQEVMVEKNDCFMVFEYLSHDLTGLLNHPTFRLEHAHKKHLARQLFEGLDHLHKRGVLHRDIKAANILVSSSGQLKLADFGLARFYAKRRQLDYTNRVITIWYRPPELLLGETQYGPAVDVWSAACVLVEIFTKHAIFPGDGGEINQLEKVYAVLGTPTRAEWPGLVDMAWYELLRPTERRPNAFREKYADRLTPAAFELLRDMFQYDPAKRLAACDVLEHPYFTAEEPAPAQAVELQNLDGDWHEFESKALRRENERRDKEARRALRQEEQERDKAKRRASASVAGSEREVKRVRADAGPGEETAAAAAVAQP